MKDKKIISNITKKRAQLEVLEDLMYKLNELEESNVTEFKCVGVEDKQATDWNTGELLWEDDAHTVPKYRPKYDNVPIPEEKLTDLQIAKIDAIKDMKVALEKLI